MARPALPSARDGFSLVNALPRYSDEQLLTLLRARPDLASPPPADLAALASRASGWGSINACLSPLSRADRQILDGLCLLPQPTTVAALVRLLAADVDLRDLDTVLGRLAAMALISRTGDDVAILPVLKGLPNPAGLGPPLNLALFGQQSSVLVATIRRLGGHSSGRTKDELVSTLCAVLSDPDQVRRALKDAPPGTTELADILSEHPIGTVNSGTHYIRPETPLGWLAERGLVFATSWDTIVMPREVGLALRGGRLFPGFTLRPPEVRWRPVDGASVDRTSTESALQVVTDISSIFDGWDEAPPKLLKAGGVGVRDLRRAATAIGRSETEAARLIELAAIAGLAGWDEEMVTGLPCPVYDEWVCLEAAPRWASLVTSWLAVDLHISLAGAIGTNGKPIPPLLPPSSLHPARHRRMLVLATLLQADPGHTAEFDSLVARVTWEAPGIWTGGPAPPATLVSWIVEEAEMLGLCAHGAMSTLGRAMVTGRLDEATAFLAANAPRMTTQFVIQADLTAVATGPLTVAVRAELESMADLESSGTATVYRFTEQTLRRAYDGGRTQADIHRFLEAYASKGVPQPLTYLVEDVGRRHGGVRVGSAAAYIRSDDPALLTEVLLARKTAKLGLRQLAPTVLVSAAGPEAAVAALRAGGYLPAEEDETGALLVRRRPVARASQTHGPLSARAFDPAMGQMARRRAAELTDMLADPDSMAAFSPSFGTGDAYDQTYFKRVVAQLRAGPRRITDLPVPRAGPVQPLDMTAPALQLDLLMKETDRPGGIARSHVEVLDLLDQAFAHEWWLRLEYTNERGRTQQINGTVFDIDDDNARVTFGTMPGYGTRALDIFQITWVRVLTEAEANAL